MDIQKACEIADIYHLVPPSMEQPRYNMFSTDKVEKEYDKLYQVNGIGLTTWSPLYNGLLTGKYMENNPKGGRLDLPQFEWLQRELKTSKGQAMEEKISKLSHLAKKVGVPLSHIAIIWCLKNTNVTSVILGASNICQLEENLNSLESYELIDENTINEIDIILEA